MDTIIKTHYYVIEVYAPNERASGAVCRLFWSDMRFELLCKWRWYFEYRAALLKVQHPRHEVVQRWGSQEPTKKTEDQIKANLIAAKKRKITELSNKLELARKHWNQLFSIEDDPIHKKHAAKIERLRMELQEFINTSPLNQK
ncbi:MAG: hypothetical protein C0424_10470 [Sphingobacteriaceae bacterium]|nr:hypothetical protein [Sphingobacteriaceae bacterium]